MVKILEGFLERNSYLYSLLSFDYIALLADTLVEHKFPLSYNFYCVDYCAAVVTDLEQCFTCKHFDGNNIVCDVDKERLDRWYKFAYRIHSRIEYKEALESIRVR